MFSSRKIWRTPAEPGAPPTPPTPPTAPTPGAPPAGTPPAPSTPTPPAPPAPTPPPALVNPDGTYAEGWLQHPVVPEEVRGNQQLATHKSLADTLKNWRELEKLRGAHVVPVPPDNADEASWSLVWERLGRPKAAVEYTLPDLKAAGLDEKSKAPDDFIDGIKADAHAAGLTQRQFGTLMDRYNRRIADWQKRQMDAATQASAAALAPVRAEWGGEYEHRRAAVETFLRSEIPAEALPAVLGMGLMDHPAVLRLLDKIRTALGEREPDLTAAHVPAGTLAQAEVEVNKIINDPNPENPYFDEYHPDHARVVEYVNQLRRQLAAAAKP